MVSSRTCLQLERRYSSKYCTEKEWPPSIIVGNSLSLYRIGQTEHSYVNISILLCYLYRLRYRVVKSTKKSTADRWKWAIAWYRSTPFGGQTCDQRDILPFALRTSCTMHSILVIPELTKCSPFSLLHMHLRSPLNV